MSIRDRVRDADDLSGVQAVPTPEWPDLDGELYVRRISARQHEDWINGMPEKEEDRVDTRANFAVFCVCDAEGKLVFTPEDSAMLGGKCAKVVDRLFTAARDFNGLKDDTAAKNSPETTDDDLPTCSPEPSPEPSTSTGCSTG